MCTRERTCTEEDTHEEECAQRPGRERCPSDWSCKKKRKDYDTDLESEAANTNNSCCHGRMQRIIFVRGSCARSNKFYIQWDRELHQVTIEYIRRKNKEKKKSTIELGCLLGSCELLTTCKEGKKIKTKWINGNKISENRVSLYYISEDRQQHQLIYI